MAEGNWRCLFEYTTTFLEECERDEEIQDCNKIEYYHERLETVFRCVYRLHEHCAGALMHPGEFLLTAAECTIVRELDSELIALMNTLSSVYIPLWDRKRAESARLPTPSVYVHVGCTGMRGRPKIHLDEDQLLYLQDLQFKWNDIAKMFGISRMTLYRRRKELGLLDTHPRYSSVSDNQLRTYVEEIKSDMPDSGERMINGVLRLNGVVVQRERLRKVIRDVDPINTTLRWNARIVRRPYAVPGPNYLWHIGMYETDNV